MNTTKRDDGKQVRRFTTSLAVDRDLWKRVRLFSLEREVTLQDTVESALRAYLSAAEKAA